MPGASAARSTRPFSTSDQKRAFPDFLDGYGHETAEYATAADWLVREPATVPRTPEGLRPFVPRRIVT